MRKVIINLILTFSLPIITGVAIVFTIFYQNLWEALDAWEQDSIQSKYLIQKQTLYNSALSQQIIEQYSFQQVDFISFYARAVILANQQGLIQIVGFSSADTSSIYFFIPTGQQLIIINKLKQNLLLNSPYEFFQYVDYANCKGLNYTEPYDPRCRFWYIYASQNQGNFFKRYISYKIQLKLGYFFYEPYIDPTFQSITSTVSSQQIYQSEFYSVDSIDYGLQNLNQQFNYTQSQNAYSILLHEFNSTVYYHPLIIYSNLTSWTDLEFYNMTSICQSQKQMQECSQEKQILQDQLSQSIEFIKNGNYSIDERENIDQLYQYWSRYGQKQVSILFPVNTYVKGVNTQIPYSHSIFLTGRLQYCQQQQQYQITQNNSQIIANIANKSCEESIVDEQTKMTFLSSNSNIYLRKNLEHQAFILDQTQTHYGNLNAQKKSNHHKINKTRTEYQTYCHIKEISANLSLQNQITPKMLASSSRFLHSQIDSPKNQTQNTQQVQQILQFNSKKQFKSIKQNNYSKKQILSELKPLFLEMQIIKETFQTLESVINYSINQNQQSEQNKMQTVYHFTHAKTTFKKLKNDIGQSRCYFNLGVIYLLKNEQNLASQYFESALQLNLQLLGINSLNQLDENEMFTPEIDQENQITILCKRIFSKAYCLKFQACEEIYYQIQEKNNLRKQQINRYHDNNKNNFTQLKCNQKVDIINLLQESLWVYQISQKIVQLNNKNFSTFFNIFLLQEIIEILIYLNQQQQIPIMFSKLQQLYKYHLKVSQLDHINLQDSKQLNYLNKQDIKIQKDIYPTLLNGDGNELDKIMNEILKSKQYFLQGLLAKQKKQYHQAISFFTQSLEESSHYSPLLRKKILLNLEEVLDTEYQNCDIQYEKYFNFEIGSFIDITILIQQESIAIFSIVKSCLINLKQSKFFKQYDRLQIQLQNTEIETFMPLSVIQSDHHFELIIKSLKYYVTNKEWNNKNENNYHFQSNSNTIFTICSYRELIFNQCPQNVYDQLNQNQFYADLYFVRDIFTYQFLSPQQQQFIQMNDYLSFYSRAAFLATQSEGLIQIIYLYNSDTTSVSNGVPSGFYNYTNSDYETCKGNNFIEPYDPRCRSWYTYAQQNKGLFFYEPYLDVVYGTILMTLSSQIDYKSQFQSVQSIDFGLQNIVQVFNSSLSLNAYSVLLHEFNSTVFYHPLLQDQKLSSWADLEFQNMTKNCKEAQQCQSQKENFRSQVENTIQFIKKGDYSIQQKYNLDQLYQYWSKDEENKISLIFPVKNELQGENTQYPYSYTVILTSRVIQDITDSLKLFKIFNVNLIRIPLIAEFFLVSIIILYFIINYGRFQIQQIQNPIELLTLFLKRSMMQQKLSQMQQQIKKEDKLTRESSNQRSVSQKQNKQSNQKKQNNVESLQINQLLQFNTLNYSQTVENRFNQTNFELISNTNSGLKQSLENFNFNSQVNQSIKNSQPSQNFFKKLIVNKSIKSHKNQNEQNKKNFLMYESPNGQEISPDKHRYEKQLKTFDESLQISLKNSKNSDQFDYTSELEKIQQNKLEEDKNNILDGLEPLFLEMQIIKDTFQSLERVINYQINTQNQCEQDKMNTLFHYANATVTFQKLKNPIGLGRCYFNLGIINLLKSEYDLASEYFETAIQLNLECIGISSLNFLTQKMIFNNIETDSENSIVILCKRVFSLAFCLKQHALKYIYQKQTQQNQKNPNFNLKQHQHNYYTNQDLNYETNQLLSKSLDTFQVAYNMILNNKNQFSQTFNIYLLQEIIEVLIYLGSQTNSINSYLKKLNEIYQNIKFNQEIKIKPNQQVNKQQIKQKQSLDIKNTQNDREQQEIKYQLQQILKIRQMFILGLINQKEQKYYEAIEYYFQSFEEGTYFDPYLRRKIILNMNKILKDKYKIINLIDEDLFNLDAEDPVDITILIQLDSFQYYQDFEYFIQSLRNQNYFKPKDRIQIMALDQKLKVLIPYIFYQNNYQLQILMENLKTIVKGNQQSSLDHAQKEQNIYQILQQSLQLVYEINSQDQIQQNLQCNQGERQKIIKDLHSQRKKILILFSSSQIKNQNLKQLQLILKEKFTLTQKLTIYHVIKQQINANDNCQVNNFSFNSNNYWSRSSTNYILQAVVACARQLGVRQQQVDKSNIVINIIQLCFVAVDFRIVQLQLTLVAYGGYQELTLKILIFSNYMQIYILNLKSQSRFLSIENPSANFTVCSYRELIFNQCPKNVYDQLNQNMFYADMYFVRTTFSFNLLTPQQQYFIEMNNRISFYARASFLATQTEGLIQLIYLYNSDTTSISYGIPSGFYNYTDSDYESCMGDSFIEPYDPRCRPWYTYAQQHQGKLTYKILIYICLIFLICQINLIGFFIYEPYIDAVIGNLLMTLSSQVDYKDEFYSVDSIDFGMQNLVQLFNTTLSENAYSVLIHEFNQTVFYINLEFIYSHFILIKIKVFYHPMLIFYQVSSWADLEYFNINQLCSDSVQQMQYCQNQKLIFSSQIDETISFIKSGNNSIDDQFNLDQLYQKWERFGQKLISIIFPIKSQIKGFNNQQPYSYTIIMTARVITDKSDYLKLFNLLNVNSLRIPLIIEFIVLSTIVIIFLMNYGYFLIIQIQIPIQLLILFLRRSYMEQQSCQISQKIKNQIKQNNQTQLTNHQQVKSNPKKSYYKKTTKTKDDDSLIIQQQNGQSDHKLQTKINQLQISLNQSITEEQQYFMLKYSKHNVKQIIDDHKFLNENQDLPSVKNSQARSLLQNSNNYFQSSVIYKKQRKFNERIINKSPNSTSQHLFQQQNTVEKNSALKISKSYDEFMFSSRFSKVSDEFDYIQQLELLQEKNNQESNIKILKGLKPSFLEMKIIKRTFQDLEGLINYQIDAQNQNSKDFMNTLFHFTKAKATFQQLKNQIGLSRCYYNLGIIYLLKYEYNLAQEHFESAITLSLEILGLDYQSLINQRIISKQGEITENQLTILCKRICSKAYACKQYALQHIYQEEKENFIDNIPYFRQLQQYSQIEENVQKINYLLKNSLDSYKAIENIVKNNNLLFSDLFQLFLCQEILEILIFLGNIQEAFQYFDHMNNFIESYSYFKNYNLQNSPCLSNLTKSKYKFEELSYNKMKSTTQGEFIIINQIKEIQKGKQKFLQGLVEIKKQNYTKATEYFTQVIEEGSYYSPQLRRKAIYHLNLLFKIEFNKQIDLQQLYLDQDTCIPYDITIILQLEYQNIYSTFETCIQNLKNQNFLRKFDRVQVLIYHSQLDVYMPFTLISSDHQLNQMISSLRDIGKRVIQVYQANQQEINWIQAIELSLNSIYEYKYADFSNFKQILNSAKQGYKCFMKWKQLKIQQNINQQQRKKILFLFSRQQNSQIQNLNISNVYKLLNNQKLIIYHLKDQTFLENSHQNYQTPFLNYESFTDESLFVNKIQKLREEEAFNEEHDFIAVLNNS
ncbi:hypothetical protein ABPG74_019534 [Tetrahymena malaccensis]